MASVNWMKMTTQAAGAMYTHLDQHARATREHSNQDIDKSRTKDNYMIGEKDFKSCIQRMKSRTKEVDAVQPPLRVKKDRVTCCMLEYPCPKEIEKAGRADEFFRKAHDTMVAYFGAENVHATFVHKDEVHTYIDSKTKEERESMMHAHTLVSAYTPEKGINGKAFETRARLNELNAAIHQMCECEFGIAYNTGETPRHERTEMMKAKSEKARVEQQLKDLNDKFLAAEQSLRETIKTSAQKQDELQTIEKQIQAVQNVIQALDCRLYPEGVVEKKRGGLFKKEEIVEVPKAIWESKFVSVNEREQILQSIETLKTLLSTYQYTTSGAALKDEKGKVKELEKQLQEARYRIRQYERTATYEDGRRDTENKINRVLRNLPETEAQRFVDEWNRDDQRQAESALHRGHGMSR